MRDISNADKQEIQKLQKQVEKLTHDITAVTKAKEGVQEELTKVQMFVLELQEQVPCIYGS